MIKKNVMIFVGVISYFIGILIIFMSVIYLSEKSAEVEINTDISKYNEYIGENAKEKYRNKWDMDESIFPKNITENMKINDYKMVYYNLWDAQYLSYLVVEYNDEDYEKEIKRLKEFNSTDYIGYYGVTGFSKYNLVAMYADSYQGFVYALTDNKNQIIYVELIFCNYCYNIEYNDYIKEEYLPDGFDATINNDYAKQNLK